MDKNIIHPELTVIVIGKEQEHCRQETLDSVACQTFTNHETVLSDDEFSALKYIADGKTNGDYVMFLNVGDLLATQMTLEENIRTARENKETDIMFFPWGNTRNGWPYTYDVHSKAQSKPGADKIADVIGFVTSCKLYGKIFNRRLFEQVDVSGYSSFTVELMLALIDSAKDMDWSPNGLYFYQGVNDDVDNFRFIYGLLPAVYTRTCQNNKKFANCWFTVLERMLKLETEYDMDFKAENAWLSEHVPAFACLFHGMKKKYKFDLLLIKILGYNHFLKRHIL